MFTGLIQAVGMVRERRETDGGLDLWVDLGSGGGSEPIGASVALAGVCCTVVEAAGSAARFQLTEETLRRTWLGSAEPGVKLNVERALRAGDPLGGHLVQGHVDAVGRIVGAIDPAAGGELWVEIPDALRRYCVEKGSIAVDGVSLTIAVVESARVMIAIVPHTAQVTTLGTAQAGQPVHLEADVIGKYVERMLEARFPSGTDPIRTPR